MKFGLLVVLVFLFATPPLLDYYKPLSLIESLQEGYSDLSHLSPFLAEELSARKGPLDLLVIGSSEAMTSFNQDVAQADLSASLGRPAKVLTVTMAENSYILYYHYLKELLSKRPVQLVLMQSNRSDDTGLDAMLHWNPFDDLDVVRNLPWQLKMNLYAIYLLSGPRRMLTRLHLLTTSHPSDQPDPQFAEPRSHYGYWEAHINADHSSAFERKSPPPQGLPFVIHLPNHDDKSCFLSFRNMTPIEKAYLPQIFFLLKERSKLAYLSFPLKPEGEPYSQEVKAPDLDFLSPNLSIDLIGVSPAEMFKNIPFKEINSYYLNRNHLNFNGAHLYTKMLVPVLLKMLKEDRK